MHTVHISGHAVSSSTLKRQLGLAGSGRTGLPGGRPGDARAARLILGFDARCWLRGREQLGGGVGTHSLGGVILVVANPRCRNTLDGMPAIMV